MIRICILLLQILSYLSFAANPSSTNFVLEAAVTTTGNNPANPPISANFVLSASTIGVLSGQNGISTSHSIQPGYYLGTSNGDILPPEIVNITANEYTVSINWLPVIGATSYKVFSSNDGYSNFVEDFSGNFIGNSWNAPAAEQIKYFYVKAIN
jgi:hypothetical protein